MSLFRRDEQERVDDVEGVIVALALWEEEQDDVDFLHDHLNAGRPYLPTKENREMYVRSVIRTALRIAALAVADQIAFRPTDHG